MAAAALAFWGAAGRGGGARREYTHTRNKEVTVRTGRHAKALFELHVRFWSGPRIKQADGKHLYSTDERWKDVFDDGSNGEWTTKELAGEQAQAFLEAVETSTMSKAEAATWRSLMEPRDETEDEAGRDKRAVTRGKIRKRDAVAAKKAKLEEESAKKHQAKCQEWVEWCAGAIAWLDEHLQAGTTHRLLVDADYSKAEHMSPKALAHVCTQAIYVRQFIAKHMSTFTEPGVDGFDFTYVRGVADAVAADSAFSGSTIYEWYLQYRRHQLITVHEVGSKLPEPAPLGAGGFLMDGRGLHVHNWLLQEEDLTATFLGWMKKHAGTLSVDSAGKYINDVLLKDMDKTLLEKHGIRLPVSRGTIWYTHHTVTSQLLQLNLITTMRVHDPLANIVSTPHLHHTQVLDDQSGGTEGLAQEVILHRPPRSRRQHCVQVDLWSQNGALGAKDEALGGFVPRTRRCAPVRMLA